MARSCSPLRRRTIEMSCCYAPRPWNSHAAKFSIQRASIFSQIWRPDLRARLTGVLRVRAAGRLTDALRAVRVCRRTPGHEHQRPADRRRPKDDSEIHTLLLFLAIARMCPVLYAGDPEASLKPLEETLNIHHSPRGNSFVPDTVDPRGPKGK